MSFGYQDIAYGSWYLQTVEALAALHPDLAEAGGQVYRPRHGL